MAESSTGYVTGHEGAQQKGLAHRVIMDLARPSSSLSRMSIFTDNFYSDKSGFKEWLEELVIPVTARSAPQPTDPEGAWSELNVRDSLKEWHWCSCLVHLHRLWLQTVQRGCTRWALWQAHPSTAFYKMLMNVRAKATFFRSQVFQLPEAKK